MYDMPLGRKRMKRWVMCRLMTTRHQIFAKDFGDFTDRLLDCKEAFVDKVPTTRSRLIKESIRFGLQDLPNNNGF